MEEIRKKKIDWTRLKKSCPICNSFNLIKTNIYKQVYIPEKNRYKEKRKVICKDCKNEFWI